MKDLNNVKKQCPLSDRQRALLFCVSGGWDSGWVGTGGQVRVPYLGHVPDPLSQPSHVKGLCPAFIFRSVLCGRHFIFFQKNLIKVTLVVIADKLHYVVNTVAC
jgi:hypothetical protein